MDSREKQRSVAEVSIPWLKIAYGESGGFIFERIRINNKIMSSKGIVCEQNTYYWGGHVEKKKTI